MNPQAGISGEDVFRPSSAEDDTSPSSMRRHKLDQQRALMQQRQKMRQAQQGMVLNRGLQRPGSSASHSSFASSGSRPMSSGLGTGSLGGSSLSIGSSGARVLGSSGPSTAASQQSVRSSGSTSSTGSAYDNLSPRATSAKTWLEDLGTEMPSASLQRQSDTERKLAAQNLSSVVDYSKTIEEPEELVLGAESATGGAERGDWGDADEADAAGKDVISPSIPHIPDSQRGGAVPRLEPLGSSVTMHGGAPALDLKDISDFIFKPAPENVTVRCRVTKRMNPSRKEYTFMMHLEQPNGKMVFLLAARKRKKKIVNYVISMDSTDLSRKGESFVGKLRSNFLGTEFTIYDNGANPKKGKAMPDGSNVRQELASVTYGVNMFGYNGPRKMTVLAPKMSPTGDRLVVKPMSEGESLTERFRGGDKENLIELHNKEPQWNSETESYVLNFYGRVLKPSVKNFQVVHLDDINYVIMQFGRLNDDQFTLDYSYPFCAVQAFGIALSSCDRKLACE